MHKRLFKSGNSMAITIDAHTRRFLGIDEHTLLHVTLEDRRIVIEKSVCDRPAMVEPVIANGIAYNHRLLSKLLMDLDRAGLTRARFDVLRHDDRALFTLHAEAGRKRPVDAVNVSRLELLYAKLCGGMCWDTAIEETLREVPSVPVPVLLIGTDETLSKENQATRHHAHRRARGAPTANDPLPRTPVPS
jgi:hypothetical protein